MTEEYNYKDSAESYDDQVKDYNSYGHDVLFGMSYDYVKAGEKILDLGIGTGLASIKFAKIGLDVYGLDNSDDMLNVCREKSFAKKLLNHNLLAERLPFDNNSFDHAISCGVFHFIADLENIISETSRILKSGGLFGFTISPGNTEKNFTKLMTEWNVPIFQHSTKYVEALLNKNDIKIIKEQRLLLKNADKITYDMIFSVIIALKKNND